MPPEPLADQPVVRTVRLDVFLPQALPTARVEVREIRMSPGVAAGPHLHNGPVFGNIVSGSAVYQIEGEPPATLTAGDVFYEPANARIARFDATEEGVTFFGCFLLAAGQDAELTALDRGPDDDR